MGMFSYMCERSDKQIVCDDKVRLYLLKDGVVQEEMRGIYDCYGAVEHADVHLYRNDKGELVPVTEDMRKPVRCSGDKWLTEDWQEICNIHFGDDESSGCAAVLESEVPEEYTPSTKSDNDPNQGWVEEDEDDDHWDFEDDYDDED